MEEKITRENRILVSAVYAQIALLILQQLLYSILGDNSAIHYLVLIVAALPMVYSAFIWLKRREILALSLYVIFAFVFFVQSILFPENISYFSNYIFYLFAMCIPCFINIVMVKEWKLHEETLLIFSIIIFIIGELILVLSIVNRTQSSDYSMSYSYYMLLPALFFLFIFFTKNKTVYLIFSIIAFLSIVLLGSRGAMISWIVFFAIAFLASKTKLIIKAVMIAILLFLVVEFDKILQWINNVLIELGLSSRTIYMIQTNDFLAHDSGRGILQTKIKEMIIAHPFVGNGIGSEYRIIGTYSHNIFLDVFLQYGIIIGVILVILFGYLIVKSFIYSSQKIALFMFACYGFVPLLVSGSYLQSCAFWIFLAYCFYHSKVRLVMK